MKTSKIISETDIMVAKEVFKSHARKVIDELQSNTGNLLDKNLYGWLECAIASEMCSVVIAAIKGLKDGGGA